MTVIGSTMKSEKPRAVFLLLLPILSASFSSFLLTPRINISPRRAEQNYDNPTSSAPLLFTTVAPLFANFEGKSNGDESDLGEPWDSYLPTAPQLMSKLDTLDSSDRFRCIGRLVHNYKQNHYGTNSREALAALVDDLWEYYPRDTDKIVEGDRLDSLRLESRKVALRILSIAKDLPNRHNLTTAALRSEDFSVSLVFMASKLLARHADLDTLREMLPLLGPSARKTVVSNIALASIKSKNRRKNKNESSEKHDDRFSAIADGLLPVVVEVLHDKTLATNSLLRGCSPETIRAHLPDLRGSIRDWKKLAKVHPPIVLEELTLRLENTTSGSRIRQTHGVWDNFGSALPILIEDYPETIAEMVIETLLDQGLELPAQLFRHIGMLAKRVPERLEAILLYPCLRRQLAGSKVPKSLATKSRQNRLRLLSDETLEELVAMLLREDKSVHMVSLVSYLEVLAPSKRKNLFEKACIATDASKKVWPRHLLAMLPHSVRQSEVQRMADLPWIQSKPDKLLELASYRNFDEAFAILQPEAKSPDVETRTTALCLLIKNAGLNHLQDDGESVITRTLRFVVGCVRNERYPVKERVWDAIFRQLPLERLQKPDTDLLGELLDATLGSTDASYGSPYSIRQLAEKLLEEGFRSNDPNTEGFRFGLHILQTLDKYDTGRTNTEIGYFPYCEHWESAPAAAECLYSNFLGPALEKQKDNAEDQQTLAIWIARRLGDLCWDMPELQIMMRQAILEYSPGERETSWDKVPDLWLDDYRKRDERVRWLLDHHTAVVPLIADSDVMLSHLINKRNTWLKPFLPELVRVLTECALDSSKRQYFRWRASETLARLPDESASDFFESILEESSPTTPESSFSSPDNRWLVDIALKWNARFDRPGRALSGALAFVDSEEHVHYALSTLSLIANQLPQDRVLEAVRALLTREKLKVTARKCAIRLLGRLSVGKKGTNFLWDSWGSPVGESHHRDTKIAFGRAARLQLWDDRAWAILTEIASDPDEDVVYSILEVSLSDRSWKFPDEASRERYGRIVLGLVTHVDDQVRRSALYRLRDMEGLEEEIANASFEALMDIEDQITWEGGLQTLVAKLRGRSSDIKDRLLATVRDLRDAMYMPAEISNEAVDGDNNGTIDNAQTNNKDLVNDLPARRRLVRICSSLADDNELEQQKDILVDVASVIEPDETLWKSFAELKLAASTEADLVAILIELAPSAAQVPFPRIKQLTDFVEDLGDEASREDISDWLDRLVLHNDEDEKSRMVLGHVELAFVRAASDRYGFVSPWVDHLLDLRNHNDVGVRTIALDIKIREREEYVY